MIKIKMINYLTCPVFFCDICKEEMGDWKECEYLIPELAEGETGDPIIGHKKCTFRFEKQSNEHWGNMGLHSLLVYLVNNHKIDFEKARENAIALNEIGF